MWITGVYKLKTSGCRIIREPLVVKIGVSAPIYSTTSGVQRTRNEELVPDQDMFRSSGERTTVLNREGRRRRSRDDLMSPSEVMRPMRDRQLHQVKLGRRQPERGQGAIVHEFVRIMFSRVSDRGVVPTDHLGKHSRCV